MVLIAILWIAFALRVIDIDAQSIWYDEGLSIYYAQGTLTQLLQRVSQSEHPPLHALLLHLWIGACGDSELSVRLLSAWWGVLAVALLHRLGRRFAPTVGLLAALLLAISPFATWYSQETRGYMLSLALTVAAVDAAWQLFPALSSAHPTEPTRRWLPYAAYVGCATAALYAHVYSGWALLGLNVAFLAHQVRSRRDVPAPESRPNLLRWIAAQLAVLVLFAPWLPFVARQLDVNATYWHGAVGWRQIVTRTWAAFSAGEILDGAWARAAMWAFLVLVAAGTLALARRRSTRLSWPVLWLWLAAPLLFQIALNHAVPKFAPRYLLSALPAFLLLASTGAFWLFQAVSRHLSGMQGWMAAALLVTVTATIGGATARSLGTQYADDRFYRPDFRAVARYIDAQSAPGDLIVLLGGHSYPAFTYYYRGPLPVLPLPDELIPTTREPVDVRALQGLDQAIAGRQRLWLVLWQDTLVDPTGLITDELQHTYPRLGVGRTFHGLALLLFDVSAGPLLAQDPLPRWPMHTDLDSQVRLLGYDLPARKVAPGETVYLYLYWEPLVQMHHDYKVFTQILDEQGQIMVQNDKIAGAAAYPTSHWLPGAIVRDRFMLTVPPAAAPGRYPLICGLYRPGESMHRLPASGDGARGDYVLLAEIEVTPKSQG
jgi:mannosyltransferase